MTAPEAAWTHDWLVAGNDQNVSPNVYGRTPTNIISDGTVYSGADLTTVSTNDTNFVNNSITVLSASTGRANHLFRFDVVTPGLLNVISNFVNFSHLVNGNPLLHRVKTYIWNAVTLQWFQIASSNSTDVPRSMTGNITSVWADYVDISGKLYILIWDWEGTHRLGGGGCVHGNSRIHTPRGPIPMYQLIPGEAVIAVDEDGAEYESIVEEVTKHWNTEYDLVRVETLIGSVVLTDDHPIGGKPSRDIRNGHKLGRRRKFTGGRVQPDVVRTVTSFQERCDVFDVICRSSNFLVGGVAVDVMVSR